MLAGVVALSSAPSNSKPPQLIAEKRFALGESEKPMTK